MPLPKIHSTSVPLPKALLQTLVVKLDKFSLVDYTTLSGSFRAARVALRIRWHSGKAQQWRMDDLGCWTLAEAENYVATLALHELNAVEGKGEKGLWRNLPPAHRDLWDELEERRKGDIDRERRGTWAMLRGILEARLVPPEAEVKARTLCHSSSCRASEG